LLTDIFFDILTKYFS